MMKTAAFLACFFLLSVFGHAQAKSVYAELAGPGLTSINFDTRFTKQEGGIGGRVGIGYFKVDETSLITVPVGVNYLLSKNGRNYFEVGAGATYVRVKESYNSTLASDDVFNGSFGHLHFGYRLQPQEGGFLFRAGITPIFGHGSFIPYYFSLAFGYKF
jgi:hypothetical protein